MEILLFFVLLYAAKRGWDDAWEAWRKSRSAYKTRADRNHPDMPKGKRAGHALRHDLGYGLSQVRHGFPQARHGFAAGWHQGRQAHAQALAGREKAKAEHLETRARLFPEIRAYRRRQKEALERISSDGIPQEPGEGSEGSGEGSSAEPGRHGYCAYCGTRDDEPCPPECATWTLRRHPYPGREDDPTYSYGPQSTASGWPSATREHAEAQAQAMSGDGDPWVVTEYPPGGGPGVTVATYRYGEEVPPAEDGTGENGTEAAEGDGEVMSEPEIIGYDDHGGIITSRDGTSGGSGDWTRDGHPDRTDGDTSPTEGTTMPSTTAGDTTYAGVKTQMQAATAQAEQWQADATSLAQGSDEYVTEVQQAKSTAATMADEMQALEVDAGSLGAMAEHLEALDSAEQAAVELQEAAQRVKEANDRVVESAQNVSSTLDSSGHGALDEAHANAAGGGGKKEFYGEG